METIPINEMKIEISKNVINLQEEAKDKEDEIKSNIKKFKKDYNKDIREYKTLLKNISDEEKLLDTSENKIHKIKKTQAITLSFIDKDLIRLFVDNVNRLQPEIIDSLMEFFGFCHTRKIDESEFKNLLEYCGSLNFYNREENSTWENKNSYNIENVLLSRNYSDYMSIMEKFEKESKNSMYEIKDKFSKIIKKYKNSLQYPLNILLEYASSVYTALELEEEIANHRKKIDELICIKNSKFILLKQTQSEVLKNETLQRNLAKYLKSLNSFFEGFNYLTYNWELNNDKEIDSKEFLQSLKEFRKYNSTSCRKFDNMNNLTLCSEYSDDMSEITEAKEKIKEATCDTYQIEKVQSSTIKKKKKKNSMKEIRNLNYTKISLDEEKVIRNFNNNNGINLNPDLDTSNNILNGKNNSQRSKINEINKKSIKTEVEVKNMKSGETKTKKNLIKNAKNNQNNFINGENVNIHKERDNIINIQASSIKYPKLIKTYTKENKDNNNIRAITKTKTSPNNSEISRVKSTDKNIARFGDNLFTQQKEDDTKLEISNEMKLKRKNEELAEDKSLASSAVYLLKAKFSHSNSQSNANYDHVQNFEQIESVNDESGVATLNKIFVRPTKISNRPMRQKSMKSMPDYLNLKFEKPISNPSGCCVSCV